jgi:septum formation protein
MRRFAGPYWLASGSPRRRKLLTEAGVPITVQPADIDDGRLSPNRVRPEHWVMALAYLKARRVAELLMQQDPAPLARGGTIIGADTVCVFEGMILGQPRDEAHAAEMIRMMRHRDHVTMTGVCLIAMEQTTRKRQPLPPVAARLLFVDRAVVTVGDITDEKIDLYVASGEWRGKAGAYNLADRAAAGWPIECTGDPTTVMGLPMQRLARWLVGCAEDAA